MTQEEEVYRIVAPRRQPFTAMYQVVEGGNACVKFTPRVVSDSELEVWRNYAKSEYGREWQIRIGHETGDMTVIVGCERKSRIDGGDS